MKTSLVMKLSASSAVARAGAFRREDTRPGVTDITFFLNRVALAAGHGERHGGGRFLSRMLTVAATLFTESMPSAPEHALLHSRQAPSAGDGWRQHGDGRWRLPGLPTAVVVLAKSLICMVPMPPFPGRMGTARWGSFFRAVRGGHG